MRAYRWVFGVSAALALATAIGCNGAPLSSDGNPGVAGQGAGGQGTGGQGASGGQGAVGGQGTGGAAGAAIRSTVPAMHRATAVACAAAAATDAGATTGGASAGPSAADAAIDSPCQTTSDCPACQVGVARCLIRTPAQPNACVCDTCNTDQDCPAPAACICNETGWARYPAGNSCVQGNCRVDSDCGPGGYCSPTVSGCGYGGYYCHTPKDTCVNDIDCNASNVGCVYLPATGAWGCNSIICVG